MDNRSTLTRERIGELQILFSVLFFGMSFVIQRKAMVDGSIGPITYTACRYIVSTVLLYVTKPCVQSVVHSEVERIDNLQISEEQRQKTAVYELWWYGNLCGLAGIGGALFQQIGLVTVTAGKTGFITGMYVIFVPIVEYIAPGFGKHLNYITWICALVSLAGLYLLSGCAEAAVCLGGAIGFGECIVFLSMLFWTANIIASDVASKRVDVISLTTVDFAVTTVFTVIIALYAEPQSFVYPCTDIRRNWVVIVVVGVTDALAFASSTLGQMYSTPSAASLLYSLEAVCCAVLSYFALGCILMTASTIVCSLYGQEDDVESEEDMVENGQVTSKVPLLHENTSFGAVEMTEKHILQTQGSNSSGHRVVAYQLLSADSKI